MTFQPSASDESTGEAAAWTLLLFIAAVLATVQLRAPLPIEASGLVNLLIGSIALAVGAWFYRRVRPRENLAATCVALLQMVLFSAGGALLSYALAREGGAFWDARLSAWDAALGFDWLAYVRWVDGHDWLAVAYRFAYVSLISQVILILLVLGVASRMALMRSVLLAAMLCGTVTILLSPLAPAVGNFASLGLGPADFTNAGTLADLRDVKELLALRDGTLASVNLAAMQGIIVFPSYHAGLAAVTCWGFWKSGINLMRFIGSPIAVLTILATPVDGGHYLVDVLAGLAVGIICIAAASRAIRWTPGATALTAWPFRRSRAAFAQ